MEDLAMANPEPRHMMSEADMDYCVEQMAKAIIRKVGDSKDLMFMGIRTRGVPMAEWLARKYERLTGHKIPVGTLDINL